MNPRGWVSALKRRVAPDLPASAPVPRIPSALVGRPSTLTPKLGRTRDPFKKLAGWDLPDAERTRNLVEELAQHDGDIVLGPWLSETGFELLYWIPFLNWATAHAGLDASRLTVVSRGGAEGWYAPITANYADVFDFYTPAEFRARNEARIREQGGKMKHVEVTSVDREIVAAVTERRGLRNVRLLHPSVMYGLFEHFWYQRAPVTLIESFTSHTAVHAPELGDLARHLPEHYVAVKFYGNTALPDTAANRAFAERCLDGIARQTEIVLLNTGERYDEHEDWLASTGTRIHRIDHLMAPRTNLDVQARIIANARAFVGTYGGFSYLAPLVGTDTLAFYSDAGGFRFDHLEIAKRVFAGLGGASFVELDVRAADLLTLGFGGQS